MGRPPGAKTTTWGVVEDRPPGCPCCASTARLSLRVVRRDRLETHDTSRSTGCRELVRRRVQCVDCGARYTLLTWERRAVA